MPAVPGLRSPHAKTGRLVYFGRMLDKIRLHAAGQLPPDYHANLGETHPRVFDALCCRFLRVPYADIAARVQTGGTDGEILAWCFARGGARTDEECEIWNDFLRKRGWRDARSDALQTRVRESGLGGRSIETFFDLIDVDEGRDPVAAQPWRE
jgi:gluconokinase